MIPDPPPFHEEAKKITTLLEPLSLYLLQTFLLDLRSLLHAAISLSPSWLVPIRNPHVFQRQRSSIVMTEKCMPEVRGVQPIKGASDRVVLFCHIFLVSSLNMSCMSVSWGKQKIYRTSSIYSLPPIGTLDQQVN